MLSSLKLTVQSLVFDCMQSATCSVDKQRIVISMTASVNAINRVCDIAEI